MDTDEGLKLKWKIQRDVTERGHSLEKVMQQIENRKLDYQKFILPQRDNSDLIINFISETDQNISLKMLINKKFEIESLLNHLRGKGLEFITRHDDTNFTQIKFDGYVRTDLFENRKFSTNSFYDYIIYFILNLKK
jgi:hypothetical protein